MRFRGLFSRTKRVAVSPRRYRLVSFSGIVTSGKVLKSYRCGIDNMATVYIIDTGDEIKYIVEEPTPSENVRRFYPYVMEHIAYTAQPLERYENPLDFVRNLVMEAVEQLGIADILGSDIRVLMYYVLRDVVGYGIIDVPIRDPNVEDVTVPGTGVPIHVVHRNVAEPHWIPTNIVIESDEEGARYVQRLAQKCGRYVSTAFPFVEAPSPEKHRIVVYLSDISGRGPGFTIRKFPEKPYSITQLIHFRTLSPLQAAYLWFAIEHGASIAIIGAMGSGKTTLLNVVLSTVRPDYKVCTVEDVPELRLPHPLWKPFYTRKSYTVGSVETDIDLFTLTKLTLRERCQVISIGEVRGEEAQIIVQAAAMGHASAFTFHAGSINEMISRMTSPPLDVGPSYLRDIWVVVFMLRTKLGDQAVRRARYVWEILPERVDCDPDAKSIEIVSPRFRDTILYKTVFEWDPRTDSFYPNTVDELIRKSFRLRQIAAMHGYTLDEIARELEERVKFLEELVREKVFDWDRIFVQMKRFYASRRIRIRV